MGTRRSVPLTPERGRPLATARPVSHDRAGSHPPQPPIPPGSSLRNRCDERTKSHGWRSTMGRLRSRTHAVVVAVLTSMFVPAAALSAQSATLSGTITAESGQPLERANAFITELNLSVSTNAQGRYSIVIPAERVRGQAVVLRARAIGHLAQDRSVTLRAGAQTFDFQLKRD